jgi:hypothetical protein
MATSTGGEQGMSAVPHLTPPVPDFQLPVAALLLHLVPRLCQLALSILQAGGGRRRAPSVSLALLRLAADPWS